VDISTTLLDKYNVPAPRYTSYPTVPYWDSTIDIPRWMCAVSEQHVNHGTQGISLYLHLPFCESLCTYCGCNKKITTQHHVEEEYIAALAQEWRLYRDRIDQHPVIRELHLGGGTPTFFSPANLRRLLTGILDTCIVPKEHEFSFEGHPNNTTSEHLQTLYDLGFRRVSFGVQDNDPEVQRMINRIQPFENVVRVTEWARHIGYESVNFDLIYGLPLQSPASLERTLSECVSLRPDRVAFYSYAHVPWTSRGQRLFDENDLPTPEVKMQLYRLGKSIFTESGYHDIGMDHFSLPSDDLFTAAQQKRLHRNFMGYTIQSTGMLLGLGVSAISDVGIAYAQNEKTVHDYYRRIHDGQPATFRGYFLTDEDRSFRKYILDMSCRGTTTLRLADLPVLQQYVYPELRKLTADNFIEWQGDDITITPTGRHFVRNICSAFDLHLQRSTQNKPTFGNAV
jgi:oxygen-independent coproporphyrinogen III oxidase